MDAGSFDRLTRLLAGRVTRRVGLAGALGALAAGMPAAGRELEARQRERERERERARARAGGPERAGDIDDREGEVYDEKRPCGPTAKDNRCRNNKDCCTRYCKAPKGAQKIGRCRCIKLGKKCKRKQKCCGGATCQNKRCTLQPAGPTCAATVCASGCPFTTVNAAYAAAAPGSTIVIAPGSHPTGIIVTKDITLEGCPGLTGVILTPDGTKNDGDSYTIIVSESGTDSTPRTVTLRNIEFKGTGEDADNEHLLHAFSYGRVSFVIDSCRFSDSEYAMWAGLGTHSAVNSTFTRLGGGGLVVEFESGSTSTSLTITGCSFTAISSSPVSLFNDSTTANATLTITGCTFTGNSDTSIDFSGSGPSLASQVMTMTNTTITGNTSDEQIDISDGTVEISGCTISGNSGIGISMLDSNVKLTNTTVSKNTAEPPPANGQGAGVFVHTVKGSTLQLAGTSSITQNNATTGGGVFVFEESGTFTPVGTTTANITGNTGGDCVKQVGVAGTPATVSCVNFT